MTSADGLRPQRRAGRLFIHPAMNGKIRNLLFSITNSHREITSRRCGRWATTRRTSPPQTYSAMSKLWREVSWISAATAALLIALFSSQNGASEQRPAIAPPVTVITKTATAPTSNSVESDATRKVAGTVRELTDDLSRITTRLAAVERSIDDLTNTVMQQNQSSKETTRADVAGVDYGRRRHVDGRARFRIGRSPFGGSLTAIRCAAAGDGRAGRKHHRRLAVRFWGRNRYRRLDEDC